MRVLLNTMAVLAVITLAMAQNLDDVSMCIIQCDAPISGCSMGGGDSSGCVCREAEASPDPAAASCLRNCAEEGGLDPRTLFRESCDAIFEGVDNDEDDDSSTSAGETTASRTQGPASSRIEESSSDETEEPNDEDAAAIYGVSVLMAGSGVIAAFLM
jgi:hypothetical protein